MMRRTWIIAWTLAAIGWGSAMADDRVALTYEVYSGGFHVMNLELEIGLAPESYELTARYRTVGLLSWVLPWNSVARSEGRVQNGAVQPVFHRVQGKVHGRDRWVQIAYRDGMVDQVDIYPPPSDDWDREAVSEEARRYAADPMSVIMAALHDLKVSGECRGNRAVFDGRRRYDIEFNEGGYQRLERSSRNIFEGDARQCGFIYRPVYGYVRYQADPTIKYQRNGRVWLASVVAGSPIVPVLLEMDSTFGSTLIHLREAKRVSEGDPTPPAAPSTGG